MIATLCKSLWETLRSSPAIFSPTADSRVRCDFRSLSLSCPLSPPPPSRLLMRHKAFQMGRTQGQLTFGDTALGGPRSLLPPSSPGSPAPAPAPPWAATSELQKTVLDEGTQGPSSCSALSHCHRRPRHLVTHSRPSQPAKWQSRSPRRKSTAHWWPVEPPGVPAMRRLHRRTAASSCPGVLAAEGE